MGSVWILKKNRHGELRISAEKKGAVNFGRNGVARQVGLGEVGKDEVWLDMENEKCNVILLNYNLTIY